MHHFITGDYEKKTVFLPDKEYGLALDALVKGCADVLISTGSGSSLRLLLGKRKVEPQPDWWFVGGRTRPGDTPAEGAARNVKRELGGLRGVRLVPRGDLSRGRLQAGTNLDARARRSGGAAGALLARGHLFLRVAASGLGAGD